MDRRLCIFLVMLVSSKKIRYFESDHFIECEAPAHVHEGRPISRNRRPHVAITEWVLTCANGY